MENPDVYEKRNMLNTATILKPGQFVLVENKQFKLGISKKLQPVRTGVYEVIDRVAEHTYHIKHLGTGKVEMKHRNLLIPYQRKEKEIEKMTTRYNKIPYFTKSKIRNNEDSEIPFENIEPEPVVKITEQYEKFQSLDDKDSTSSWEDSDEAETHEIELQDMQKDKETPKTDRDTSDYFTLTDSEIQKDIVKTPIQDTTAHDTPSTFQHIPVHVEEPQVKPKRKKNPIIYTRTIIYRNI